MIRTVIIGAAGRMGRMLIAKVAKNENFELAGATEYAGSPDLGKDAGILAGVGELGVKIKVGTTKLYVSVSNSGETIPANELPLVFDRFHKTDKSRSQNRDGWGLGLYIVKTIIGRHGEDISVTSQNGITTFTFTLPLVN